MKQFKNSITPSAENKFSIYVYNIKILSNTREGDQVYSELITSLFSEKVVVNTYGDKAMKLRTQFFGLDNKVIYGKIVYYTTLEGDNWFNENNNEYETLEFDRTLHPNPKETSYFFVPNAHRFAIIANKGLSVKGVFKYLTEGLAKTVKSDEEIKVSIEQSNDGFEQIFRATEINRVKISLSYTNNDLTEDFEQFLDDDLKNSRVGEAEIIAKSSSAKPIDIKKSKLLTGAMRLAKSNGNVEANIINEFNKNELVNTEDYPEKLVISAFEGEEFKSVYNKIMSIFRENSDNEKE